MAILVLFLVLCVFLVILGGLFLLGVGLCFLLGILICTCIRIAVLTLALGSFVGELDQLLVKGVVVNLLVPAFEQNLKELVEPKEWVGRTSLALRLIKVVVTLRFSSLVWLKTNIFQHIKV